MLLRDLIVILSYLFVSADCSSRITHRHGLVVQKAGLADISPSSVGLQFLVKVNNTGNRKRQVDLVSDACCVDVGHKMDCGIVVIMGRSSRDVDPGSSEYLKLIAPLLDPFERKGYCNVFVVSKAVGGKRVVKEIKIPFDTRVRSVYPKKIPGDVQECKKIDQDPLNGCQPVICQRYYNGKKSYFSNIAKRCVEVPLCSAEVSTEMPRSIYDPAINQCIQDTPITLEDISQLKAFMSSQPRQPKDILIVGNVNKQKKFPSLTKKHNKVPQTGTFIKLDASHCSYKNAIVNYLMHNRCAYLLVIIIVFLQCGIMFCMGYYFTNRCFCTKKKLVRKYYNYRQDATITTPLIDTNSHIETDTTDFHYTNNTSESSNIDKRIKIYKSCQKEVTDAKISLSDDILSKCLTRRDWRQQRSRSEALQEFTTIDNNEKQPVKELAKHVKKVEPRGETETMTITSTEGSAVFINYQTNVNETKKQGKSGNTSKKKPDRKSKPTSNLKNSELFSEQEVCRKQPRNSIKESDVLYSEQEINCHSYNWDMDDGSMPSYCGRKQFCTTPYSVNPGGMYATQPLSSVSTEKSGQASFPNDSIDELLSEQAMLLIASENISKYSFSTGSRKVASSISGKTSKNNVVKNLLSILHRKSKTGPSSDPGVKKSKQNLDLEVIHISPVSNYSSANETGLMKGYMKGAKDSRSST